MRIKQQKDRVLLSEVLPYETPIIFSNRYFYEFVVRYSVSFNGKVLKWRSADSADQFIFLIFGLDKSEVDKVKFVDGFCQVELKGRSITIPFNYGVSHKENSFRTLSLIHPRNQIQTIDFYDRFKELITYYCQRSKFSLRHPERVATSKYFDDSKKISSVLISKNMGRGLVHRYNNLRSFFSYKSISNVYQFYESDYYHQCEKKYESMAQLDISKCFDSLYTHSISWAVLGRDVVKETLARKDFSTINDSFPDHFDKLMQQLNYNETNGVVIGPELSRIFAEIILQKIDCDIQYSLNNKGIRLGVDYECFRYVDDYFLFFNEERVYRVIVDTLETCLKEYKLGLNFEKEVVYKKPIITELTIAKRKMSELLSDKLSYDVSEVEENGELIKIGSCNIQSSSLITKYKMILSESGVDYKGVLNYTLSIVERSTQSILKKYASVRKDDKSYKELLDALFSIIEFSFFIYSVEPRVNTTIKISRLLKILIDHCRSQQMTVDDMHHVFSIIYENISFILVKYRSEDVVQVETLYLLLILDELGREYRLEEQVLVSYFGGRYKSSKTIEFSSSLNYFSIIVMLFYVKDKSRYSKIKNAIEVLILDRFDNKKTVIDKDTETLVLLLDCLSCPYLSGGFKKKLLRKIGIRKHKLLDELIGYEGFWFTKWKNFELGKELDAKKSEEVY